ncbi:MAG: DUF1361 domain-containing protein [Ligilactobacillus salivarius]|nr:DUF1361 domain-containing protein [Ligilactobacillus salivarius]
MPTKLKWFIRTIFVLFMIYIYIADYSRGTFFSFLLLNTFLGYIPVELAMHINEKQNPVIFWLLFFFWLLFYPNAPYVLTDLFHLARFNPYDPTTGLMTLRLKMWLEFTNLISSALGCTLMGLWSFDHFINVIAIRWNKRSIPFRISLAFILTILSSIGIYVGRFLRLHSAYLFTSPKWVVDLLIGMWNARMLTFVIFMTIIQLIVWASVAIGRHSIYLYAKQNNLEV